MTLRKFSLLFVFGAVVIGSGILGWYLLTRGDPEEEVKVGKIVSQSTSNGVHMLEGKLNNTMVFSGITWVDEVISVMCLLTSFIVYKLIRYRCKTPATLPADPPVLPPPAPEPAPSPPQAPQPLQHFYPPPSYTSPYSVQLMTDQAAASMKSAAKKAKIVNVVNAIESESDASESECSDTTSSVVVTVPPPADKKRRNKPRSRKANTDKENIATA